MTTYSVTIFGIHLVLKPVAFTLPIGGGYNVYWYGIIIATGFMLAILYAMLNAERFSVNKDRLLDVVLVATPVAILSARLYYVLFDSDMGIKDYFNLSSNGGFAGLAIYGGIIGALLSGAIMCYVRKLNILNTFDLASVGFLIGQGIGRWGNFINQEAFGAATGSSWFGMTSEAVEDVLGEGQLAHPCFLYESVWCLVGAYLLHRLSKNRKFSGQIILSYCVWYGFGRAIIELLRTDSLYIGGIKVSFLLSLIICVAAAVTIYIILKHIKINEENNRTYVPMFAVENEETLEQSEPEITEHPKDETAEASDGKDN